MSGERRSRDIEGAIEKDKENRWTKKKSIAEGIDIDKMSHEQAEIEKDIRTVDR